MISSIDSRYFGVYEALVDDAQDPENKGRIKVKIPQLFGSNVTEWIRASNGAISQLKLPYGVFSSSVTQSVGTTTALAITFNSTEESNDGVTLGSPASRLYVNETGQYNVSFKASFKKSTLVSSYVDIWFRVNGVDVAKSTSRSMLQGDPTYLIDSQSPGPHQHGISISSTEPDPVTFISGSALLNLEKDDYVQIMASASASGSTLQAYSALTAPTRPNIPSIIANINLVGNYKPQPGTIVWIMFIAGDPNYPIWVGVE